MPVAAASTAYFLIVNGTGGGPVSLRNVRFFSGGVERIPTAVSGYGGGTYANLIDGNAATIWTASSYSGGVQFAFSTPYLIDDIKINPNGGGYSSPQDFKFQANDSGGNAYDIQTYTGLSTGWTDGVERDFPLTVTTALTVSGTAGNGTVGTPYSWTFTASNGTSPYTYSVGSGSLPAGVTLNTSTGALSGTPTTAGTSTFVIHAVDSGV